MKKPKKEEDNKVEYGTISLPLPLINKIKKKMIGTGMSSISSYVTFVMREVLASTDTNLTISKKDKDELRNKLKKLGYL